MSAPTLDIAPGDRCFFRFNSILVSITQKNGSFSQRPHLKLLVWDCPICKSIVSKHYPTKLQSSHLNFASLYEWVFQCILKSLELLNCLSQRSQILGKVAVLISVCFLVIWVFSTCSDYVSNWHFVHWSISLVEYRI